MRVTREHFPDTIQLGDINKIDIDAIPPVDIICAGSPCQDLSIAGLKKGLGQRGDKEVTRSGLFRRAIDIVRGLRARTGGRYPRWFVFENVTGIFSSAKGMDFKAVLEEVLETEIPMPRSGRWANAGVVRNGDRQCEWRVLDAQHWNVAQRRQRLFLVCDFTAGQRGPREVLFEPAGLPGDTASQPSPQQGATTQVGGGTAEAGGRDLGEYP